MRCGPTRRSCWRYGRRRGGRCRRCRTGPRWRRCGSPTGWSWAATGGGPRGWASPRAAARRGSRATGALGATEAWAIAQRDIEKVFPADDFSAVAIAGAAGPAIEMVRLFQSELEHYEKIEGFPLSLEGKANRLGQMVRGNLPLAMQGLVVVPLFCGYDTRRHAGRIFRYDVTGGRWEDADFPATGSGGRDARGSLKKRWRPDIDADTAEEVLVEALHDAGGEGGAPRRRHPVVV